LSGFVRICIQSLEKEQKKLIKILNMVSKNAEFHADFELVGKILKIHKKSYQQKRDGNMHFFTFPHVHQTCFAYDFFV
jgi:hypothetical protein